MQEIKQLSQTLGQLHKSLTDEFQHEEEWMGGTYFIVSNFRPKADKAQTIVAKALEAKLQVAEPDDNLAITNTPGMATSGRCTIANGDSENALCLVCEGLLKRDTQNLIPGIGGGEHAPGLAPLAITTSFC